MTRPGARLRGLSHLSQLAGRDLVDEAADLPVLLAGSERLPVLTKTTHRGAAAISDAQIRMLEGHAHFAHKTDPAMVAAIILPFISP